MPNIEIKAKCSNLDSVREAVRKMQTDFLGSLHQIDTYFETKEGRLKLREINGRIHQLIPYIKEYKTGPMKSLYSVLPVDNPDELKIILNKLFGIITVVDKKREVFLKDNIRIHLDIVKNLGSFIEFEAVYSSKDEEEKEKEKVKSLMTLLNIKESDLLDRSYIDYLLIKKT